MAGWDDINLPEGQELGSLTSGYIMDIALVDTYIRAINEKARLFYPQSNAIEPIDKTDGKPYVWTFSILQDIIRVYGALMTDFKWVQQGAFDDPMTVPTSIYNEDAFTWTEADIIVLIGQDMYDILADPLNTEWTLRQLQSADLFNAMYILYSTVFLVTEKEQLEPLNHRYDLYETPSQDGGKNLGGSDNRGDEDFDDEAAAKNRMNVTSADMYDVIQVNILTSRPANFMSQRINGTFRHTVPNVTKKEYITVARTTLRRTEAVHQFRNDLGEFVKLDISMSVNIDRNYTQDLAFEATPPGFKPNVFSPRNTDLPIVKDYFDQFRMTSPPPDDSFIDENGWVLQFWGSIPLDYNLKMDDFHYDYDLLSPPTGAPFNHDSFVSKTSNFTINHRYDIYYNCNVEDMVYNTLEDEEEDP